MKEWCGTLMRRLHFTKCLRARMLLHHYTHLLHSSLTLSSTFISTLIFNSSIHLSQSLPCPTKPPPRSPLEPVFPSPPQGAPAQISTPCPACLKAVRALGSEVTSPTMQDLPRHSRSSIKLDPVHHADQGVLLYIRDNLAKGMALDRQHLDNRHLLAAAPRPAFHHGRA